MNPSLKYENGLKISIRSVIISIRTVPYNNVFQDISYLPTRYFPSVEIFTSQTR